MFLYEAVIKKPCPRPTHKGFAVYEYRDVLDTKIEIISFFWEVSKGRPNSYKFRYSTLKKIYNDEYILDHISANVAWHGFFDHWQAIKNKLKTRNSLLIAGEVSHAKLLIWKSFVMTQDYTLSKHIHNFPASFYESIDDRLAYTQRLHAVSNFITYLRHAIPFVYSAWLTYFETNMDMHYCNWFKPFVEHDE
jgi:hypothetical protein